MAEPEIAGLIGEFEDEADFRNRPPDTRHHDQPACVQSTFVKDVQSMVTVMEDFVNPFEEESQDLLVLDTKEIAPLTATDASVVHTKWVSYTSTTSSENGWWREQNP